MTRKKLKYIQLALEASIPLMGYFFWEWNLYFILLFYFLDIFSSEAIMHFKGKQVYNYNKSEAPKAQWIKWGSISLVLMILSVLTIHFAMLQIHPNINFSKEVVSFWEYEELGVQQGYLFVPLVFLMSWQQYKMEFKMQARYRTIKMDDLWKKHVLNGTAILSGSLLGLGIAALFNVEELYYILLIVGTIVFFKLLTQR